MNVAAYLAQITVEMMNVVTKSASGSDLVFQASPCMRSKQEKGLQIDNHGCLLPRLLTDL